MDVVNESCVKTFVGLRNDSKSHPFRQLQGSEKLLAFRTSRFVEHIYIFQIKILFSSAVQMIGSTNCQHSYHNAPKFGLQILYYIVRVFLVLTNYSKLCHRRSRCRSCLPNVHHNLSLQTITHSTALNDKRRVLRCVLYGEENNTRFIIAFVFEILLPIFLTLTLLLAIFFHSQ